MTTPAAAAEPETGGESPADKPQDTRRTVRRLVALLGPYRLPTIAAMGCCVIGVAANTIGPLLLGKATDLIFAGFAGANLPAGLTKAEAIDRLRAEGNTTLAEVYGTVDLVPGSGVAFGRVAVLLAIALALYLVASSFMYLQERIAAKVVQKVAFDVRERVEAKLPRLPLSYFDRRPVGELLSRVTNDVDNLQTVMQQTFSKLASVVLALLTVLVMMLVISPLLTVLMLLSIPLSGYIVARVSKRTKPHFVELWADTGALNSHVEQMYTGHALVRVFGQRETALREFDECNDAMRGSGRRAHFFAEAIEPALLFVANLNYVMVAVVGALRVASGALSLGSVQAFMLYTTQFNNQAGEIGGVIGKLQSGFASAERVFELLDAEEQRPDPPDADRAEHVRGSVEFDRVSFRYTADRPLIEDLSLTVRPGQVVAIVGPTGAGKTTLGNLLMRFHEVDGGRILLDGRDIATMTRQDVRSRTGLVLQDTWLFEGTIADNIAYGLPGATREQVVAAARAVRVDHFVRTMPDGYDTVFTETAAVSAGEKQLVTVARAFLADPAILILDEATSSVDTRSEVLIQKAMTSLRAGRTCFVIAHRLSTIQDADVILVMEDGKIVERGAHGELLRAKGAYARLFAAQFARTAEDEEERPDR
ncbi:ABC transporter ATP-binding protein [Umezawaea endophytica]|uniref:Fatty acid ABC transporter ATP-binding/permease protein n=1 Tax=Umezawaea endophytica TaxID=1654476 RepID=A0A9X2VUY5_9PSEU|nr:ABC transporter ATP-binding protein [Umezawaea endophytica]MCS7483124.1 ABC transporter ATP-binding protein/permease [Umezawaea endophytica]